MELPSKEILFASTIFDSTIMQNRVWFQRLDSMGNHINSVYFNRLANWSEFYGRLYPDRYAPNFALLSTIEFNHYSPILESHNILRGITPAGGVRWMYVHPEHTGMPNDVIRTLDSGFVVGTSKGYSSSPYSAYYTPYMYKLNKSLQVEWTWEDTTGQGATYDSKIERVFEQPDSSMVAIGVNYMEMDTNSIRNINLCGIYKIAHDGSDLWRRYVYLLDHHAADNLVKDARQTSDGGFIICGETGGGLFHYEPQRGWLLKVDSMGCLTAGCHLLAAQARATASARVEIYPNPVQAEGRVFVALPQVASGVLVLYDAQGRALWRQHFEQIQEATFVFDMSPYAAGLYVVSLEVEGKKPESYKLVK